MATTTIKNKIFIEENDLYNYQVFKEFPVWKTSDLPKEIENVENFARLEILKGKFLFMTEDFECKLLLYNLIH
jgi:tellurite resistance-related uncharacterized protein